MLCRFPYMFNGTVPTKCGRCQPCRIQHAQLWTARQLFESLTTKSSYFTTLTYSREHHTGNLDKPTLQKYVKRLRKNLPPRSLRYYACGEYGTKKNRPHYHLSLFSREPLSNDTLQNTWGLGTVHTEPFNSATAAYVCSHLLKGRTQEHHHALKNRVPEFNSKSQGLGRAAMAILANAMHSTHGLDELERTGDVPYKVYFGKRAVFLGAWLRKCLRKEMGFSDELIKEISNDYVSQATEELQELRENSALNLTNQGLVIEAFGQNALNMTNRYNIRHGGTL